MERRAQRYTVWLPVRVDNLAGGVAVSHNVSGRGILLVTASTLDVGSPVELTLQLPPDGKAEEHVKARVVRVEQNSDDPDGMWPHRLALEFDQALPALEKALAELVEAGIAKIQR